ncbi:MAG: RNase H family protein [Pirellulaceae bacterium]
MVQNRPHFLLLSEATDCEQGSGGRWHFLLESVDGETIVEAADEEMDTEGERLELLAVVRGLEALDQPSRVTLVTPSRRVSLGFRRGLDQWRTNGWQWEQFGRKVPIKNSDLWRRIDHAMKYHSVDCRMWRFDSGHLAPSETLAEVPVATNRHQLPPSEDSAKARETSSFSNWLHRVRDAVRNTVPLRTASITGA